MHPWIFLIGLFFFLPSQATAQDASENTPVTDIKPSSGNEIIPEDVERTRRKLGKKRKRKRRLRRPVQKLYLGVGGATYHFKKVATKDDGTKGVIPFYFLPLLAATGKVWWLRPTLTYAILPRSTVDAAADISALSFSVPFALNWKWFDFKLGPGVVFMTTQGEAGTVEQRNGTSTATFAKPGGTSTARLFWVEAGIGAKYWRLRLDLNLFATGVLGARRSFGTYATLSFGVL